MDTLKINEKKSKIEVEVNITSVWRAMYWEEEEKKIKKEEEKKIKKEEEKKKIKKKKKEKNMSGRIEVS